jgi:hypothetical protein
VAVSAAGRGVARTDKRRLADPAQVPAHEERSVEGRLFRAARRSPRGAMVARRTEAPRGANRELR